MLMKAWCVCISSTFFSIPVSSKILYFLKVVDNTLCFPASQRLFVIAPSCTSADASMLCSIMEYLGNNRYSYTHFLFLPLAFLLDVKNFMQNFMATLRAYLTSLDFSGVFDVELLKSFL